MTKQHIALIGAALYSAAITAHVTAAPLELPQYGFAIEALDAQPSAATATTALLTFLPTEDGFAPNINVTIQPYAGTITSYIAMSKDQFKQMNLTIISEKQSGDNEWIVEYSGPMQGNDLHYYARAVSTGGKVYLVTSTAKESQWKAVSDVLRKHVDSFQAK